MSRFGPKADIAASAIAPLPQKRKLRGLKRLVICVCRAAAATAWLDGRNIPWPLLETGRLGSQRQHIPSNGESLFRGIVL
jgi:hypothetical protein